MFFPGKEEFIWLEEQVPRQSRIYMDACDVGIALTDQNKQQFHAAIKELASTFKYKIEECGKKTDKRYCWTIMLFIPIEADDNDASNTIGYAVELSYNKDAVRSPSKTIQADEWMSIYIDHVSRKGSAESFLHQLD